MGSLTVGIKGALFALTCFAWGCSSGIPSADEPDAPDIAESADVEIVNLPALDVNLGAERVGSALRLDVRAIGRIDGPGAAFENPDRWRIEARQQDRGLQRLVNGSVRVERSPFGLRQWDSEVRFSVVYRVEDAGAVHVRLVPPESEAVDKVIEL